MRSPQENSEIEPERTGLNHEEIKTSDLKGKRSNQGSLKNLKTELTFSSPNYTDDLGISSPDMN